MSYSQLQRQVNAFANGLLDVPFKSPATLVIWAKDCAETYVAQLGAVKAGVKVVNPTSAVETKFFHLKLVCGDEHAYNSDISFLQVVYLDGSAKEEDLVKALDSGARWLLVSPSLLPQVYFVHISTCAIASCPPSAANLRYRSLRRSRLSTS